jgi:hypothetical protein
MHPQVRLEAVDMDGTLLPTRRQSVHGTQTHSAQRRMPASPSWLPPAAVPPTRFSRTLAKALGGKQVPSNDDDVVAVIPEKALAKLAAPGTQQEERNKIAMRARLSVVIAVLKALAGTAHRARCRIRYALERFPPALRPSRPRDSP